MDHLKEPGWVSNKRSLLGIELEQELELGINESRGQGHSHVGPVADCLWQVDSVAHARDRSHGGDEGPLRTTHGAPVGVPEKTSSSKGSK